MPDGYIQDPRRLQRLTQIYQARRAQKSFSFDLEAISFPAQAAFIKDPARRKAALCTRRAGKTWATVILLAQTAIQKAGTNCAFLSYTLKTAKGTILKPLSDFLKKSGIGSRYLKSEHTFELSNGSTIILLGADKPEQVEKLRGDKYPLVVIDECGSGSYKRQLDYIVDEVLAPAVAQYRIRPTRRARTQDTRRRRRSSLAVARVA
jgi:hypothetical protein